MDAVEHDRISLVDRFDIQKLIQRAQQRCRISNTEDAAHLQVARTIRLLDSKAADSPVRNIDPPGAAAPGASCAARDGDSRPNAWPRDLPNPELVGGTIFRRLALRAPGSSFPYGTSIQLSTDTMRARYREGPGMNALGWSLERGWEYMREHSGMSEAEIRTEPVRYSCDIPGQALAYELGDQRLLALRDPMRSALGERFDIRDFHESILAHGALPLPDVEWNIKRVIAARQGRT